MDWTDSAMLLQDGRALVFDDSFTEVWDPATSTFGPAGLALGDDDSDFMNGRLLEATLLADGRILFISDEDPADEAYGFDEGYTASAEVWDPVTGTSSPAGSPGLIHIRSTTLLADGRVLIVGFGDCENPGTEKPDCVVATEVWDPATSAFSPAGSLPGSDRHWFTATALSDGRALVAGGCSDNDQGCYDHFDSAQVWDPDTETFGPTGSLSVTRSDHTATALPDGRVLVVGGRERDYVVHDSAEVWEPGDR
jgi:hypothetical protein